MDKIDQDLVVLEAARKAVLILPDLPVLEAAGHYTRLTEDLRSLNDKDIIATQAGKLMVMRVHEDDVEVDGEFVLYVEVGRIGESAPDDLSELGPANDDDDGIYEGDDWT